MKDVFLKKIFLFFVIFVFSACEDLSFTDEDIFQPEIKKEIAIPIGFEFCVLFRNESSFYYWFFSNLFLFFKIQIWNNF